MQFEEMMGRENHKDNITKWELELEGKPDFMAAMQRIYAWYEGEIIDRVPVRFSAHNAVARKKDSNREWKSLKEKWFDVEFQVEGYIESIQGEKFLAETFPIYWPNLGPNVYNAFHGSVLEFAESTSWAEPSIKDWEDLNKIHLDMGNKYFRKIDELTEYALERCTGRFMVGYTDLHPGVDCVAAWRESQNLCYDLYDYPKK